MVVALLTLLITLALRSGTDEAQPQSEQIQRAQAAPLPTATPTPNPFAVTAADDSITIDRLWSPAPLVARVEGVTTTAGMIVSVEANGRPMPPVTLDADSDGRFTIDIRGLEPGPQEVCVAGACQRVLVADPGEESRLVIDARIERAIDAASERFDIDVLVPGWTFVIARPNSSTGGSANQQDQIITINANSGRSLRDYEITVVHEIGHAVDATWMDDDERTTYRSLRELDAALPWGAADGNDRWNDAGEDFAEMFVALVFGPDYPIMTSSIAAQPTDDDIRVFCELVAAEPISCDAK